MGVLLGLVIGWLLVSCGSSRPAECDEIAEMCDGRPGARAMECHEAAHETWTGEQCRANRADCLAACAAPADAAADADAGSERDASSTSDAGLGREGGSASDGG
jgi:hypothetical protein